jgi:hypothetical protein
MKSSLLKENPLKWLNNTDNSTHEISICPFSKKFFSIETILTNSYKWKTTLKVNDQLIFEETVSKINIDKFKKLAESLR